MPSGLIRTSRVSSRGSMVQSSVPGTSTVGTSFVECTQKSTSLFTRATSNSRVNRPLPPISDREISKRWSPVVEIVRISTAPSGANSGKASAKRRFVSYACARARGEPRVPSRKIGSPCASAARGTLLCRPCPRTRRLDLTTRREAAANATAATVPAAIWEVESSSSAADDCIPVSGRLPSLRSRSPSTSPRGATAKVRPPGMAARSARPQPATTANAESRGMAQKHLRAEADANNPLLKNSST
mmetsp:Transcript_145901/g.363796  ORF Transcript_145901/g.363796 Transcript_145901/m.363796 type:complete len:244 (+) Transcript_145901:910-1641(+)